MMKKMTVCLFVFAFLLNSGSRIIAGEPFRLEKVSERIRILTDTDEGSSQLVILTSKGMVVLNSFWSEITADKFKKEWARALGREDFIYNINTVDRLDIIGGNSVYGKIPIIGHQSLREKFTEESANAEIKRLVDMWRYKEDTSRKRLPAHRPGSKEERNEIVWMNTCKQRADELEQGFSLLLPGIGFTDEMTMSLGDTTLRLIWFGKAGYNGMTLIHIPEEKILLIPGFILHPHHLAPHPYPDAVRLDIPRWIRVLEDTLTGEQAVETVIINAEYIWPREQAEAHLDYIRSLWNKVRELETAGKSLEETLKLCSLDGEFSFVKSMKVYTTRGDDWIRPQHQAHVTGFYLQLKDPRTAEKMAAELREKSAVPR